MLFPIKNREDLEKLNELVSLQNQVKTVRLQDNLGEQNFREDLKEVYEPLTNTIKNVSENISKTLTESSINNNKAIENLNEQVLESTKDKGLIDSSILEVIKDSTGQFRLIKDPKSTNTNDFLINENIPVTIFNDMLTFRDTNKIFKLEGDLLEVMSNNKFNVDRSNQQNREIIREFAKEMKYNTVKNKGRPPVRHKSIMRLLNQPPTTASGVTKTIFLSSNPDELCNSLRLLLQEKHAGNNSDIINKESVAIVDKLLEYKCISKKQHKQILNKCDLL